MQVLKDWSHPQASSDFLNIYVQYLEREEEKIISYLEYFAVVPVLAEGVTHCSNLFANTKILSGSVSKIYYTVHTYHDVLYMYFYTK